MSTTVRYVLATTLAISATLLGVLVARDPAPICQLTPDGSTCMGGECHGELICCDKATGGCFCADTEHGAVCPPGSVKAPESEAPTSSTGEKISPAPDSGDGDGDPGDGDGEPAAKRDLP
jgi:hypothetical protein